MSRQYNCTFIKELMDPKTLPTVDCKPCESIPYIDEACDNQNNITSDSSQILNARQLLPVLLNIQNSTGPKMFQKTVTDASPVGVVEENTRPLSIHNEKEVMEVVEKKSEIYKMNHSRRGKAIIFNHETFSMREPDRDGSKHDVDALTDTLTMLGFEVATHNDLTQSEIGEVLDAVAAENHDDADCLLVVVLSHGVSQSLLAASKSYYSIDDLWTPFKGNKCTSLAGKPKIFIIQACRGVERDAGVKVRTRSATETDSAPVSYKIPVHADFLIAYSTADGYVSFRDPKAGTWYIQTLCKVIKENYKTHDLLKMLTITARIVSTEFLSDSDNLIENDLTQIPCITSMLIRDVFFTPSPQS